MGKLARLEHQALRRAECSSEITAAREARDRAAARQEEAACLALATLRSCTQPLDKDLALAMHLSNIEEEERRSVLWRQLPDDVIEHVLKLMDLKRRHQLVIKACKERASSFSSSSKFVRAAAFAAAGFTAGTTPLLAHLLSHRGRSSRTRTIPYHATHEGLRYA